MPAAAADNDRGPAPETMEFGELRLTPFVSSRFRLDGGSMFGVVPRVLWEKKAPPDTYNRILLHSNSLLVEDGARRVLVEPGMGAKYDRKQREIYDLADGDAASGLRALGLEAGDIDIVVPTHLHLDHAGGCTALDASGRAFPVFPNARVVVQREEWEAARAPHALSAGSYSAADFLPLMDCGLLDIVEGGCEVAPGLRLELTGGHTPGHQVLWINSGGAEALFVGDIVPTFAHLKLNWLMAWDIEPMVVYRQKARLLEDCARRSILLFTAHDPETLACRVREVKPGTYAADEESAVRATA
jgi:glyoxylase-like metal-dependent hydrolase (beta-lactamase superfamily II)